MRSSRRAGELGNRANSRASLRSRRRFSRGSPVRPVLPISAHPLFVPEHAARALGARRAQRLRISPRTAGTRGALDCPRRMGMALLQDVRLAMRRMRRSPLFALSVAGTLALGHCGHDRDLHRRRRRAAEAAAVSRSRRAGTRHLRLQGARSARHRPFAAGARGLRAAVGRVRVDRRHLADHREPHRLRSPGARRGAAGERQLLRPARRRAGARPHLHDARRNSGHRDRRRDQRRAVAARLRRAIRTSSAASCASTKTSTKSSA